MNIIKKKILFVINSLAIGGSERSLVSLLNLLDYEKYNVDLMLFKKGEPFDIYIPKQVTILDEPEYYRYISNKLENRIKYKEKIKYLKTRILTTILLRIKRYTINSQQILYKSQKNTFKKLSENYDVAIAYAQGMPTYFVTEHVVAKKKIAWINCDYATTKYDKEYDEKFYNKIDNIIVVSKTIEESILKIKPQYRNKIKRILDIVNPDLIKKMANKEEVLLEREEVNIVTVARLVIEHKGYDLAIKAANLLMNRGYKFKWFIIGDGPEKKEIESLIKKYEVKDCFILLGEKENPYPYMKFCDIYVQPSKKEGFGLTVVEAKILNKPIVCTNFNTAKEIINNNIDGVIVDIDEYSLAKGIEKYIEDTQFKEQIKKKLKVEKEYKSIDEMKKIYDLL